MNDPADEMDPVPFTPAVILEGYRHGIFPMGEEETEQIYWFRPDPRAILPLDRYHVPRRLLRVIRQTRFDVTYDQDFPAVVAGCAEGRPVWITNRIRRAYEELHRLGHAHSLEVWQGDRLVGGIYGVHLGGAFMAESKFHRVANASKVALVKLAEHLRDRGFAILEVQYLTEHLARFGAVEISLASYLRRLRRAMLLDCRFGNE